ncbi:GreA/GreB family elongation factor, partial [Klebsiella quasipneumoniae]
RPQLAAGAAEDLQRTPHRRRRHPKRLAGAAGEIFGRKDYISIDSPMARALLKKEVGDLAIVNTPAGEASWYVNEIEYVK